MKALLLLAVPAAVFLVGVWAMDKLVGREAVKRQLREKASIEDRKPLYQRLLGYDADAVARHWGALDKSALKIEQNFLKIDLVFPFLYGAALVGALLIAWSSLERPFHSVWLVSPVVIAALADWTENLVQLAQLRRYVEKAGLQPGWIQIASFATSVKLVVFAGACLLLVYLVGKMLFHGARP